MVLHDLQILDLCAGTGNISIEFLSRECGHLTAVDKNYNCIRHVQQLSRELECREDLDIVKGDIIKFLKNTDETFDIIFADPPYAFEDHHKIAELTFERDLLTDAGLLVIEHGKLTDLSDITQFRFSRKYGNVVFSFFTKKSDDE
jgi:16S rRNA (guanine966-N2)-methyltransferase